MEIGEAALNCLALRGVTAPLSPQQLNSSVSAIVDSLRAMRDSRDLMGSCIESHVERLATHQIIHVKYEGGHRVVRIDESIDTVLRDTLSSVLDNGYSAQAAAAKLCRELGHPVSALFGDRNLAEAWFRQLREGGAGEAALAFMLEREQWLAGFRHWRSNHVHHGWRLPRCSYEPAPGEPPGLFLGLPSVDSEPVIAFAERCTRNNILLLEQLLVWALQTIAFPELSIAEIPICLRDQGFPKRFEVHLCSTDPQLWMPRHDPSDPIR